MNQQSIVLLSLTTGALISAGCGASPSELKAPIPQDLTNPATLDYSGLTRLELVDIASIAVDELGLTALQADGSRGYLETAFVDVADFNFLKQRAVNYPTRERLIQIQVSIRQTGPEIGSLKVGAYYRPFRPLEDRLLPRDHAGYAVLNAVVRKLASGIGAAGGSVTRSRGG